MDRGVTLWWLFYGVALLYTLSMWNVLSLQKGDSSFTGWMGGQQVVISNMVAGVMTKTSLVSWCSSGRLCALSRHAFITGGFCLLAHMWYVTYAAAVMCWWDSWAARMPFALFFALYQLPTAKKSGRVSCRLPGMTTLCCILLFCVPGADAVATRGADYGPAPSSVVPPMIRSHKGEVYDARIRDEILREIKDLEDTRVVPENRDSDTHVGKHDQQHQQLLREAAREDALEDWRSRTWQSIGDPGHTGFKLVVLNVDGLFNTGDWASNFKDIGADVAILTESKLGQQMLVTEGYTVVQSLGPEGNSKGGVAVLVKNELLSEVRVLERNVWSQLWLSVPSKWFGRSETGRRTLLGALYVAPVSSKQKRKFHQHHGKTAWASISDVVEKHAAQDKMDIILAGDLNTYTDEYAGCAAASDERWKILTSDQHDFTDWCEQAHEWTRDSVCHGQAARSTYFKHLNRICDTFGLLITNGLVQSGTHRLGDPDHTFSRIATRCYRSVLDYVIVSPSLLAEDRFHATLIQDRVDRVPGRDHRRLITAWKPWEGQGTVAPPCTSEDVPEEVQGSWRDPARIRYDTTMWNNDIAEEELCNNEILTQIHLVAKEWLLQGRLLEQETIEAMVAAFDMVIHDTIVRASGHNPIVKRQGDAECHRREKRIKGVIKKDKQKEKSSDKKRKNRRQVGKNTMDAFQSYFLADPVYAELTKIINRCQKLLFARRCRSEFTSRLKVRWRQAQKWARHRRSELRTAFLAKKAEEWSQGIIVHPEKTWRQVRELRRPSLRTDSEVSLRTWIRHLVQTFSPQKNVDDMWDDDAPLRQMKDAWAEWDLIDKKAALQLGPISEFEVQCAIRSLRTGAAPGQDGVPMFVLKQNAVVLAARLTPIIDLVLRQGLWPCCWSRGVVSLLKKSPEKPNDKVDSYRGICCLNAVGKLAVAVVVNRLHKQITVSQVQRGFRSGGDCADNLALIRALQEAIVENGFCNEELSGPLRRDATQHGKLDDMGKVHQDLRPASVENRIFLFSSDIRKAFPWVSRPRLMEILTSSGCEHQLSLVFWKMMEAIEVVVVSGGGVSPSFQVRGGLREGCLASPVLWALFVDDFIAEMERRPHHKDDIIIEGVPIRVVAFADDLLFFSRSPEHLQDMIHMYHDWCQRSRVTVSQEKSVLMVLHRTADDNVFFDDDERVFCTEQKKWLGLWESVRVDDRDIRIVYGTKVVRWARRQRYLGLYIQDNRPLQCAAATQLSNVNKVLPMVQAIARELAINKANDVWAFYRVMVVSKLLFACPAWFSCEDTKAIRRIEWRFMSWIAGVGRTAFQDGVRLCAAPCWGSTSVEVFLARLRFVGKLVSAEEGSHLHRLLQLPYRTHIDGSGGWLRDFVAEAQSYGLDPSFYRDGNGPVTSALLRPPKKFLRDRPQEHRVARWVAQITGKATTWVGMDGRVPALSLQDRVWQTVQSQMAGDILSECQHFAKRGFFLQKWFTALGEGHNLFLPCDIFTSLNIPSDRRSFIRWSAGEARLSRTTGNHPYRAVFAGVDYDGDADYKRCCIPCFMARGEVILETEHHLLFTCPEYADIRADADIAWIQATQDEWWVGGLTEDELFVRNWQRKDDGNDTKRMRLIARFITRLLAHRDSKLQEALKQVGGRKLTWEEIVGGSSCSEAGDIDPEDDIHDGDAVPSLPIEIPKPMLHCRGPCYANALSVVAPRARSPSVETSSSSSSASVQASPCSGAPVSTSPSASPLGFVARPASGFEGWFSPSCSAGSVPFSPASACGAASLSVVSSPSTASLFPVSVAPSSPGSFLPPAVSSPSCSGPLSPAVSVVRGAPASGSPSSRVSSGFQSLSDGLDVHKLLQDLDFQTWWSFPGNAVASSESIRLRVSSANGMVVSRPHSVEASIGGSPSATVDPDCTEEFSSVASSSRNEESGSHLISAYRLHCAHLRKRLSADRLQLLSATRERNATVHRAILENIISEQARKSVCKSALKKNRRLIRTDVIMDSRSSIDTDRLMDLDEHIRTLHDRDLVDGMFLDI